ncbi:MAG: hypothetical protein B9S34_11800 [Opitutia bacterium Tous-C1TDCM]|nr:MAG: hypothetical protein B9S34_11800 [Opitutae bacterium Tous-C1TDCM]
MAILLFSLGIAGAAPSPASLAGTVFRERGGIAALRLGWQRTIIFTTDTKFVYVKALSQSFPTTDWAVETAGPDGSYVYRKTGASTGELTFSDAFLERVTPFAGGGPRTLKLEFADESDALAGPGDVGQGTHDFFGSFALSKLATAEGQSVANLSMRGRVAPGNALVVGFVLKSPQSHVMIRVVGPSLRAFGIPQTWANPRFELHAAGRSAPISGGPGPRHGIAYYEDWSRSDASVPGLNQLFSYVGAFSLEAGSRDAVGVSPRIGAGAYTVVCTAEDGDPGGEALVEVYVLP